MRVRISPSPSFLTLAVVSGEQLVGIVSLRDLLTLDREVKEEEIQLLDAYIRYIPPPPARD